MWNIKVQYKDSPHYMQVENQSGNIQGHIIVVEEVQDPDNVNGMLSLSTAIFCALYRIRKI